MANIPPLETLGRRIAILGPSNAGKSTLAVALAERLGVPAFHIDQFRHQPGTDWQQRPESDFIALHEEAIARPEWVMDGGYSVLLPSRMRRATGIIVLDDNHWLRLGRYFRRTLSGGARAGGLAGARDSVKWEMIRWIWVTRNTVEKYRQMARQSGLPHHFCASLADVRMLYIAWGLTPPR
ncbi:Adenylate kinase [Devosia enhydra]|uniref:Adenylate kinase n=1 Tax=Devosia enhydra TaxID=665118 RepID=A0A1K2HSZ2_9HYPH|nr:AAA family ATPase [Devosia enhydra]SFZ81142.1 Adenylate kinase [Devosia enhydra]